LPLVHTAHTLLEAYRHYLPLGERLPKGWVQAYLRRFLSPYRAIVCPSPRMQSYLASLLPGLPVVTTGNGLDRALFSAGPQRGEVRERVRHAWGLGPDERLILYVGRLGREKRIAELLAAVAPLLRVQAGLRFLLAGNGPERHSLEQAVARAGLGRQVIFAGALPWERVRDLGLAADVLVTASLSEVQPMSLIEASLAGLPVVARRDPATAAVVCDGASGYLVDSDAELAPRLAELLADEELRLRFSRAALDRSRTFDLETHAERMECLYQRLLSGCSGAGRREPLSLVRSLP
jgi:1,2-diacylglycerol 3-alpha-glucosyltransferase